MTESATSPHPANNPRPASPPPPRPGRYRIDLEHSTVTITTRHLFGLGGVRGTLALRDGRVDVGQSAGDSAVQARVAVSTFHTGNDARDASVLSPRLLDAEAYPTLVFTSTGLSGLPGGSAPPRDDSHWVLHGELQVRGVTRPVEVQLGAVSAGADARGTVLQAAARFRVDRYAFGITAYRGLAARWLTVDVDIRAERTAQ
jgi:polyisoprenoid-binding protein YceI